MNLIYTTLSRSIKNELPFVPTQEQTAVIDAIAQFCTEPTSNKVFMLKGFAGTGKTSVVSALITAMRKANYPTMLLAPTGRAAKVLGNYSSQSAFSIHKVIYRQERAGSSTFHLGYNSHKDTLFIVDEASMIANQSFGETPFGTGRLLDDLVEYVYSGDNCSMLLLGDTAQLLPIGQSSSPALDKDILEGYGLEVREFTLTQVARQTSGSGILHNATIIRKAIETDPFIPIKIDPSFEDVKRISGEDLIDELNSSYSNVGEENTIILTYSNKRAVLYNKGVRNQVLMREEELSRGDYLIITKNNYFLTEQNKELDFIANGDIAEIVRIRRYHELYGLRFAETDLKLVDYDIEITAKIIVDSLYTDTQAAQQELNNRLTSAVEEDYMEIGDRQKRWKAMQKDEYFNALQVKFAYAITGHKAQGGAWQHVYIDQGYITQEHITREYYQWLYTAITRARDKIYLINFSDFFFM